MNDNELRPLTREEITELSEAATTIRTIIGRISKTFQTEDRRELLRPRKGSESFQRSLFAQAKLHHIELDGYNIEDAERAQLLVKQLQDMSNHIHILDKTISDTLLAANSLVWDHTLNYYRVLNAVAQGNSTLAIAMKPLQEFMSRSSKRTDKDDKEDEVELQEDGDVTESNENP